jgi:hypothetical protein
MRIRYAGLIPALAVASFLATPALPHHSNVAFEVNKIITLTGEVTEFRWVNPHTWIGLNVDDGKGGKALWSIEGRAPGVLLRAGWSKNSIKAGDTVTIDFSPAKDGTKTGLVARVTKADGTILANGGPPQE